MDSIACHGGPIKVSPASVHFLAKVGFSLNWSQLIICHLMFGGPYKAITWMYALTSLLFCDLDYTVATEICGGFTEIDGVGRAKSML